MIPHVVVFKTQESKNLKLNENFNLTKYYQYLRQQFPWFDIRSEPLINVAYTLHSTQDINYKYWATNFRRVRKSAKSGPKLRHVYPSVCPSACPSAWTDPALTGRTVMKFGI
jgi:hypothetical protein